MDIQLGEGGMGGTRRRRRVQGEEGLMSIECLEREENDCEKVAMK